MEPLAQGAASAVDLESAIEEERELERLELEGASRHAVSKCACCGMGPMSDSHDCVRPIAGEVTREMMMRSPFPERDEQVATTELDVLLAREGPGDDASSFPLADSPKTGAAPAKVDGDLPAAKRHVPDSKAERPAKVAVNLNGCCYSVVGDACRSLGWKVTAHDEKWTIRWVDRYCLGQTLRDMRLTRPQRINHFPAICEIAFKCRLANNLNKMRQRLPEDFSFYPQTWVLPEELGVLDRTIGENPNRTYIVKPNNGSQGQGIFFTRRVGDIPKEGKYVAQRYLNKPLLIDKLKFDLRIYVLITSVFPLRIYVAREGLARFCTEEYEGISKNNRDNQYKHLTNYAINKKNDAFQAPTKSGGLAGREESVEPDKTGCGSWGEESTGGGGEEQTEVNGFVAKEQARTIVDSGGSKRSLLSVYNWLDTNGFRSDKVKRDIHEVVVKTVLSALPANQHAYKVSFPESRDSVGASCFTVLGFDVMLDSEAKVGVARGDERSLCRRILLVQIRCA